MEQKKDFPNLSSESQSREIVIVLLEEESTGLPVAGSVGKPIKKSKESRVSADSSMKT